MPIFDYDCSRGHRHEEVFLAGDPMPETLPCPCGAESQRRDVNKFRISGPVWSNLDDLSRTYGSSIKSAKDIAAWETKNKLARLSDYEARIARDTEAHATSRIRSAAATGGTSAGCAVVEEMNMCEGMGWSKSEFTQWKEKDNDAHRIGAQLGALPERA